MMPRTIRYVGSTAVETVKAIGTRIEKFSERALDALQRNLLDAMLPAVVTPIVGGNLILDVAFTPFSPTPVLHRLGRAYVGVIVCAPLMVGGSHLAPTFWRVEQSADLDASQVQLACTATCTAPVYVF